ncbi:MAG: hypothetical protein IIT65_10355 [Lachnospiraceae bacterium]|nr:hypothetical protein [Lachnospiraceae bacterium]
MNIAREKVNYIKKKVLDILSEYSFNRINSTKLCREHGDMMQYIIWGESKTRGKDEIYLRCNVGFSFDEIDQISFYLEGRHYENGWGTANIGLYGLSKNALPIGYYLNENADEDKIAHQIINNIVQCAMSFWKKNETIERFYMNLLDESGELTPNMYLVHKRGIVILACAIKLGKDNTIKIIEKYGLQEKYKDIQKRIKEIEEMN